MTREVLSSLPKASGGFRIDSIVDVCQEQFVKSLEQSAIRPHFGKFWDFSKPFGPSFLEVAIPWSERILQHVLTFYSLLDFHIFLGIICISRGDQDIPQGFYQVVTHIYLGIYKIYIGKPNRHHVGKIM